MKYLKIKNKGQLDVRLIFLMGASTKTEDTTKIGQFGTGLKYAISYLMRNKVPFRLFCGQDEVKFTTRLTSIGDKQFEEILCNGQTMNITTSYGYQWKAWEAIREIWCNAMDEGTDKKTIVRSGLLGIKGETTFYIGVTDLIQPVLDAWDSYFITKPPLFKGDNYSVYENTGRLKLYKHGVLIFASATTDSLFSYDVKSATLNELRQFMGSTEWAVTHALVNSSREIITKVLEAIANQSNIYETRLDYQYVGGNREKIQEIFSGYLFLHPNSSTDAASKNSIRVNQSLYNFLKENGLPCERVVTAAGGYYGGGSLGYGNMDKAEFKEVVNRSLQAKIIAVANKYGLNFEFKIVVPLKDDFEILFDKKVALFSSSVASYAPADLETTVLVALLHSSEDNIYKAFKRFLKAALNNRNFKKLLFGHSRTGRAVYVEQVVETPAITNDDLYDDLPF